MDVLYTSRCIMAAVGLEDVVYAEVVMRLRTLQRSTRTIRSHERRSAWRNARRALAYAAVLGLAALLAACGSAGARRSNEPPTVLEVENNAALDMNVYVVQTSGARNRLGTATAHTRQYFRIPDRLIFGATPLRFQADPIGGNRLPVTHEITVAPGDTIVWRIPPY